jgi:hypothetical protein
MDMIHYNPPRIYLVTRIERYEQLVEVEAPSKEEALRLAADDCGTINSDPEFHSFTDSSTWAVEEVKK